MLASLFLLASASASAQSPKLPLLILLSGDAKVWQNWCHERGWQFLDPWNGSTEKSLDMRIKALDAQLTEARKSPALDENRIYIAAQGISAWAAFYVASRAPDLFAAAVALGGSPRGAIDSNRLFAANTTNLPVLWVYADKEDEELGPKLKSAGFNLEWRQAAGVKSAEVFDWLAAHERAAYPNTADCETGSALFPHCYWVEVTRFDATERNEVLDSTRVPPIGSWAALAVGSFGYDPAAPGPGVVVNRLPEKYSGPLKLDDRIIEMGGKELKDPVEYAQILYRTFDEKPVVLMVERGKERVRIETRVVFPPREETVTARVQARYLPAARSIEVISRAVSQIKLNLPKEWLPVAVNWNGAEVAHANTAGCLLLEEKKELLSSNRCP